MKLYNKTKCPDSILEPLLIEAGKLIGARTTGVVVKTTQGKSYSIRGLAYRANCVFKWHLEGRGKNTKTRILTDCGYIKIALPSRTPCPIMAKDLAESFFRVAMHEWAHVRDCQNDRDRTLPWSRTQNGRRPRHNYRPEEQRAECYVQTSLKKTDINTNPLIAALTSYLLEPKETYET